MSPENVLVSLTSKSISTFFFLPQSLSHVKNSGSNIKVGKEIKTEMPDGTRTIYIRAAEDDLSKRQATNAGRAVHPWDLI